MGKKNKLLCLLSIMMLLFLGGRFEAPAQGAESEGITLTWQDLQKLLDIDAKEIKITWAELKKLLMQTGSRMDPDFEIKDGIVTIKREQFSRILNRMKPVHKQAPAPPKQYLLSEAVYTGTAGEKNSRFSAVFKIYVFKQDKPAYMNIPIVHTSLAVKDILVNNAPAVILTKGSWHHITVNKTGYIEVKAVFSAGQGNRTLNLPVVRSMINRVDYTVPIKDLTVTIDPSLNTRIRNLPGGTRIRANTTVTDRLDVVWKRKTELQEKRPALFYAATRSLVAIDADILRLRTAVNLDVIQGSLNAVSISVPENYQVVKVEGAAVSEWKVRDTDIGRVLEVPFRYDIDRSAGLTIHGERILAEDTLAADFSGFKVVDARRETGNIGIVAESSVQVEVEEEQENKHLKKLAYHKLPQGILNMTSKPILSAYKYSKHPFKLFFRIGKHDRIEGITTVIESAAANALFLKEGKILTHLVYTVRNTFKQFMELELPPEAAIWTVYVDNKRGKASKNEEGKLLIPLLRSPGNGEQLRPFPVELIYTLPAAKFGLSGSGECFLPASDIFINKMKVTLHLPPGYRYNFDKGEWKEEIKKKKRTKAIPVSSDKTLARQREALESLGYVTGDEDVKSDKRVRKPAAPKGRKKGKTKPGRLVTPTEIPKEIEESEADIAGGVRKVTEGVVVTGKAPVIDASTVSKLPTARDSFADKLIMQPGISVTGPAGVSSIKVNLPLSGEAFVFSKKIIDKNEKIPLRFSYLNRGLITGLTGLAGLIVLAAVLFIIRRKIRSRFLNSIG